MKFLRTFMHSLSKRDWMIYPFYALSALGHFTQQVHDSMIFLYPFHPPAASDSIFLLYSPTHLSLQFHLFLSFLRLFLTSIISIASIVSILFILSRSEGLRWRLRNCLIADDGATWMSARCFKLRRRAWSQCHLTEAVSWLADAMYRLCWRYYRSLDSVIGDRDGKK